MNGNNIKAINKKWIGVSFCPLYNIILYLYMKTGYKRIIKHSWTRNINWVSKIRPFGWDFIPHINTCFYPLYFICSFLMHILKILWRCKILKVMYHKPSIQFCKSSLFHNTIFSIILVLTCGITVANIGWTKRYFKTELSFIQEKPLH